MIESSGPRGGPVGRSNGPAGTPPTGGMDVPRRARRRRRSLLLVALAAVALFGVTWAVSRIEPAVPEVERDMLVVSAVRRGDLPLTVRGWGELLPDAVVRLAAPASALVKDVLVVPGSVVREAQPLVLLDSPELEVARARIDSELAGARAERERAAGRNKSEMWAAKADAAGTRAQLARSRREAESLSARVAAGAASETELARHLEQMGALEEKLKNQSARFEAISTAAKREDDLLAERVERLARVSDGIREKIEALDLRAPAPGVIRDVRVATGDRVEPGRVLVRLDRPERFRARINVPASALDAIGEGQDAILVDAAGDSLPGRVVGSGPESERFAWTEISLLDTPRAASQLNPEVDAVILTGEARDVLWMERPAFAAPHSLASIFRLDPAGEYAERVKVRLGRISTTGAEVLEGLKEGDHVIVSDMSRFDDFDCVRVR